MTESAEASSRFLVGIDLGTTNSALAFVDTADKTWRVRDFAVPQLVGPGQIEARDVLPSFYYEAAENEFAAEALRLPWETGDPSRAFVGVFARDHGAEVPGRLIYSAKSWLSHSGVDRTAGVLPWHGAPDVQKLSPVEVSSIYLGHLRAAWDAAHREHPLRQQEVVVAVPASFDEVARELTIAAAQRAGLPRVFLVEEPQAAFYAWIDAQATAGDRQVRAGQTILVCDVGGGTSDFTLIRVEPATGGGVNFHRVAVGEHLILGGDNLDLALAHHVEQRLGTTKLQPRQWAPLIRICRQVKETFLGPASPERMTVSLAAPGAKLIGAALQIQLARDEVTTLLIDGFLPAVDLTARPAARRSGFQEFGLPYAADAGITRYLAAFLRAHRDSPDGAAARPDLVLFNGGLFASALLRQRLIDVLRSWFASPSPAPSEPGEGRGNGYTEAELTHWYSKSPSPQPSPGVPGEGAIYPALESEGQSWAPIVLQNNRMDLAVARGAAYYAMVRRGRGVRITGGLAHSYYLGVETGALIAAPAAMAVCLMPAGIDQGQTVNFGTRRFALRLRQPAEFPLYFSSTRTTDRPGELVAIDPEQLSALPPIRTVLQSSRAKEAETVSVQLHAQLTEVGTLDIWCSEADGGRRWKLQFDVRAASRSDVSRHAGDGEALGVLDEQVLGLCRQTIQAAFAGNGTETPAGVVKRLETITDSSRHDWPPTLLRAFWESLLEMEETRRRGVEHEARWLSLLGFSLRPGYGLAVDDWRVAKTWRLFQGGTMQPKNELCRAEWWILWRRLAGGLLTAQQTLIGEPLAADWRTYARKGGIGVHGRSPNFQFGPHESAEVWRLLGSLELLRPLIKSELGNVILDRLPRERSSALRDALLFTLGRLGARQPVYGPLNTLISPEEVEQWVQRLLTIGDAGERLNFAVVQLSRRTGDRHRDLPDALRDRILDWLAARGVAEHLMGLVRTGGLLEQREQRNIFGETLPRGLRIE